jgi:hypothetical protein
MHVDWSQVMPDGLTFSHPDSSVLLQVYELLILRFIAGVWVVHNTSSIARLILMGHRGIHLTLVPARDYAAVFTEGFGAFVCSVYTLGYLHQFSPFIRSTEIRFI